MTSVSEFLHQYYTLSAAQQEKPLEIITRNCGGFIETGVQPDCFRLNGNSKELSKNRLNDSRCTILMKSLHQTKFLAYLDLSLNHIGDEGAIAISKFISDNAVLLYLNLSGNNIESIGGQAIANALTLSSTALKGLDISRNPIGNEAGIAFAAMLQVNTVLEYLNIDGTALPAHALVAFATVLHGNRTVQHFHCADNFVHPDHISSTIYDDVVQHMFKMVHYNESLVHLSLSKMAIKDRSIVDLLSVALKANKTLVELDLSSNKIMGDGGCAIAKCLHYHPRLMILNLSHNQIQDDGTIAISEMLLLNSTLKNLYLGSNNITPKGLCQLAKVLTPTGTRGTLTMGGPPLKYNYTLKIISLWGNKWDPKSCETWNRLIQVPSGRFKPEHIDITFFRPSEAGAQVDDHHVNAYQVAHSAAVTLGFGPGTLREPTQRRRSQLPAKHSDCWLGQVSPTLSITQKSALVTALADNEETVDLNPWCLLGGLSGLIGTVQEEQPYEHRRRTPDMEATFLDTKSELGAIAEQKTDTTVENKADTHVDPEVEKNAQESQAAA